MSPGPGGPRKGTGISQYEQKGNAFQNSSSSKPSDCKLIFPIGNIQKMLEKSFKSSNRVRSGAGNKEPTTGTAAGHSCRRRGSGLKHGANHEPVKPQDKLKKLNMALKNR